MAHDVDVHRTMLSLELTLERTNPKGTLVFDGTNPNLFGATNLRRAATIPTEFHSGSARPLVGPVIAQTKRVVRRALRWYVAGIIDQQSRFNHQVVDAIENLTVRQEHLVTALADLEQQSQRQAEEILLLRGQLGDTATAPVAGSAAR
ncbi:MAG TPA: hypothetical protein VHT75_08605 [Acidimicrobiales bacterium]|jgi:hypothetical protein|nr:hypothetical protein [Acidimicrobiales bacterium]